MNPAIYDHTKTEFFTWQGQLMVIHKGTIHQFDESPIEALEVLREDLDNNPRAIDGLQLLGITNPIDQLRKYAECRYGALDEHADFGGTINDEMINCEHKYTCKAAGLICKRHFATHGEQLSSREVEVGCSLACGKTVPQIATSLFVAPITIHSTLLHIKQKLNLPNYPAIAAFFAVNFYNS